MKAYNGIRETRSCLLALVQNQTDMQTCVRLCSKDFPILKIKPTFYLSFFILLILTQHFTTVQGLKLFNQDLINNILFVVKNLGLCFCLNRNPYRLFWLPTHQQKIWGRKLTGKTFVIRKQDKSVRADHVTAHNHAFLTGSWSQRGGESSLHKCTFYHQYTACLQSHQVIFFVATVFLNPNSISTVFHWPN